MYRECRQDLAPWPGSCGRRSASKVNMVSCPSAWHKCDQQMCWHDCHRPSLRSLSGRYSSASLKSCLMGVNRQSEGASS